MQEIGLDADILEYVLKGKKTIEGRLRTSKFQTLRKGDKLSIREDVWKDDRIIKSTPNKAEIKVTDTLFFDTFDDMFNTIDFKLAVPRAKSKQQAINAYRKYYSIQQEREYGVIAIGFSL